MLELTEVGMRKAYRMSFDDFICSEVERIGRDELWACLSFIIVQEGGDMHGTK